MFNPKIRRRKIDVQKAKKKMLQTNDSRKFGISPELVLKAIEGTGGIKKTLAERLGISYRKVLTLMSQEGPGWDDVRIALKIEYESLGDLAENTIKDTMRQRLDIGTASKSAQWFLDRKFQDRGYGKKDQMTIEGGANPVNINMQMINISELELSMEVRRAILDAIRVKEKKDEEATYQTIDAEVIA